MVIISEIDQITLRFDTGEILPLNFDESRVMAYVDDQSLLFAFMDYNYPVEVHCFTSQDYASLDPFMEELRATGEWPFDPETFSVSQTQVGDFEFQYIFNGYDQGFFCIPLAHDYALLGYLHYTDSVGHPELDPLSVWQAILSGSAASTYEYEASIFEGDEVTSMIYSLDGQLYRFPTPAGELIKNGWEIPEYFSMGTPEIAPGEYVEAAFKMDDKTIWNVLLYNPGSTAIPIQEGIVSNMLIAQNSNVDLALAEGISLHTTEDIISASTTNLVFNGNYATYSWWDTVTDSTISAYIPSSSATPEYFEFNVIF